MDNNEAIVTTRGFRKKRKKKLIIGMIALIALLAVGAFSIVGQEQIRSMVATYTLGADVDAEIGYLLQSYPALFTEDYGGIDADELRERMIASHKDRKLLASEASKRGISVEQEKVDASFEALKSSLVHSRDYKDYLAERGLTEKQLKAALADNMLITELARTLVSESDISEADARAHFEANKSRYQKNSSKRASHILFDNSDADKAASVHSQLLAGADFATLAAKHSKDSGSAARAGDIGWVSAGFADTFLEAVDELSVGEVSKPITTSYGIHLVMVTDAKPASSSFEEAKAQVTVDLLGALRAQAIDDLLLQLKG